MKGISNKIFIVNIAKESSIEMEEALKLLPLNRVKKTMRYMKDVDKKRSLVAGLLLRKYLNITEDSQMSYNEYSKPFCTKKDVFFNISHGGDYVILGVSQNEIGVDVEKISEYDVEIANHAFCAQELNYLSPHDKYDFYKLWTRKESIMKALGMGFFMPEFSALPIDDRAHFYKGKTVYTNSVLFDGHYISCTSCDVPKKNIFIEITAEELLKI